MMKKLEIKILEVLAFKSPLVFEELQVRIDDYSPSYIRDHLNPLVVKGFVGKQRVKRRVRYFITKQGEKVLRVLKKVTGK